MHLCFSCQHEFPSSLVTPCSFSEIIVHLFEEVNGLVNEINSSTPEETHQKNKLQATLRGLCSAVNQEIEALKGSKGILEAMRDRDRQDREIGGTLSRDHTSSNLNAAFTGSQNIGATISAQNKTLVNPRATFNGTVPAHRLRKMNTSLELVSASIYCVMESLAIRARAEVALLWIPPPGVVSMELVAPFVVGRDTSKLRNSAPYRVSETSVPCAVSETGIAVNIKPRPGTQSAPSLTLMEMIESSNAAQLLFPVYTRYGEVRRSVLGVVHLIGSPVLSCPFTTRNEEMAVHTAATLSVILSSYSEKMCGEWANRIYDQSLLADTAAYRGTLDTRSQEKGIDDFAPPHTLVYRCTNDRCENDDNRESVKALRIAMVKRAAPKRPVTSIRDLYRFAMNMESNWVSAVKTNTEMGTRIAALEEQALRKTVESELGRLHSNSASFAPDATTDSLTSLRKAQIRPGSAVVPASLTSLFPAVPSNKGATLKNEEINEIEISALRRMQNLGIDARPFMSPEEDKDVY